MIYFRKFSVFTGALVLACSGVSMAQGLTQNVEGNLALGIPGKVTNPVPAQDGVPGEVPATAVPAQASVSTTSSAVLASAPAGESAAAKLLAKMNEAKPAVLVKVDNIKTIKNEEGLAEACDFNITVYNRTGEDIVSASVEMTWKDETIENFLEMEEAQRLKKQKEDAKRGGDSAMEAARSRLASRRAAKAPATEDASNTNTDTITLSLKVPEVGAYSQVVIPSHLKSDRCFLLVSDASLAVESCTSLPAGRGQAVSAGGGGGQTLMESFDKRSADVALEARKIPGGCGSLFKIVSAKEAQYYLEFKKVDVEIERLQKVTKNELLKQALEDDYKKAIEAMDELSEVLETIK